MEDILAELLSSSSSSSSSSNENWFESSSDDEDFFNLQAALFRREQRIHTQNFVNDVVQHYSEGEFRRKFRISRRIADTLIDKYKNSVHYKTKLIGGRRAVSAESQCLAFLWFAGNRESIRETANLFNITTSAVHTHITNFLEFLFEISALCIKFPVTDSEKFEASREFAQIAGFPNVIGCIDVGYINIRKPVNKLRSTYVNRHGSQSITLQGICDANKKFLDVFIGSPSKINNSGIYSLSYISDKMPGLCGKEYHILGGSTYPLREYLLTPYRDTGRLNHKKAVYNEKHRQTTVTIENTFDLLKQRFRKLRRLDFFAVERMCKFVMGCCVLHNLCIEDGDIWDEENVLNIDAGNAVEHTSGHSQEVNENAVSICDAVLKHLGESKRDSIMNTFNTK